MKMVSAAKLKKAQDAIIQMRPYSQKLEEILMNVSATLDSADGVYARKSEKLGKVLLVAISSNRGLCGAFNANVTKKMVAAAEVYENQGASVEVFGIGKKSYEMLERRGLNMVGSDFEIFNDIQFSDVAEIAEMIMDKFANGEYDRVDIFYNQFKNAAVQHTQQEQYLPVKEIESGANQGGGDYIYEPQKEEILEDLIPKSLKTQLFKGVLDSNASEHGARMTAMHKATDNANELVKQLKLSYNKARQAAITNEILEIVGGAEALNG